MNLLLTIVVHTANILGSFDDPFEFAGDYGPSMNETRSQVFERVLYPPKETPLLEIIPPELVEELLLKLESLDIPYEEQEEFVKFIFENQEIKSDYLSFDKLAKEQKLPILTSTIPFDTQDAYELKLNLLEEIFTPENRALARSIKPLFYYWVYQCKHIHLIAKDPSLIEKVNTVKAQFAKGLGNPMQRALKFREKIILAETSVLFTQECDKITRDLLTDRFFHSVDRQNNQDGTLIFLKSTEWEKNYEVLSFPSYPGFAKGKLNAIVAKTLNGELFLLASCHGNSTKPEDGRHQISLVVEKYEELLLKYPDLQLIIGIDANTKSEAQVEDLQKLLESYSLISTRVGPTTIKQRMITAQLEKSGRYAIDEEDFLITKKPGIFINTTVGFTFDPPNTSIPLPNINNLSDHYPIGAEYDCCRERDPHP